MTKIKTNTISEFIKKLEDIKKDMGDLPLVISSDSEGNSFGTLHGYSSLGAIFDEKDGKPDTDKPLALAIYPWEEGLDYSEIR